MELYGGHFAARVPVSFIDISTVRQVPNHQEFYADTSSGFNVIFEINEMQKVENSKCIEYFFNDLAKGNDAKATRVHSKGTPEIPSFKNEFTAYIVGESAPCMSAPCMPQPLPCFLLKSFRAA